jgi:hypothetical protein
MTLLGCGASQLLLKVFPTSRRVRQESLRVGGCLNQLELTLDLGHETLHMEDWATAPARIPTRLYRGQPGRARSARPQVPPSSFVACMEAK